LEREDGRRKKSLKARAQVALLFLLDRATICREIDDAAAQLGVVEKAIERPDSFWNLLDSGGAKADAL
jgi:hypothetical protein